MSSELASVNRAKRINDVDIDFLCDLLSTGHTVSNACVQVGISVRTFNRWRLLGQDPEEEQVYENFYFKTELARGKSINHLLDSIYNQAQYDPKVAMWLIERLHPEQFSLKPEFRKTKDDIKEENFGNKPQRIEISFGDNPIEQKFKRAVEVKAFEKFLVDTSLTDEDKEAVTKQYSDSLIERDKGQERLYETLNNRSTD